MCEQKLRPVHHVHGDQITRLHAVVAQVLPVAACVRIRLSPSIAAIAGPDGFFVRGEAMDLGFELVPEALAFALGWWVC